MKIQFRIICVGVAALIGGFASAQLVQLAYFASSNEESCFCRAFARCESAIDAQYGKNSFLHGFKKVESTDRQGCFIFKIEPYWLGTDGEIRFLVDANAMSSKVLRLKIAERE
ncbi:MAG: hypothetical protein E7049_02630 [Lentisphaerae bacterium]|nr:hypothetical protein [Lentisphaerota bacterium]